MLRGPDPNAVARSVDRKRVDGLTVLQDAAAVRTKSDENVRHRPANDSLGVVRRRTEPNRADPKMNNQAIHSVRDRLESSELVVKRHSALVGTVPLRSQSTWRGDTIFARSTRAHALLRQRRARILDVPR